MTKQQEQRLREIGRETWPSTVIDQDDVEAIRQAMAYIDTLRKLMQMTLDSHPDRDAIRKAAFS